MSGTDGNDVSPALPERTESALRDRSTWASPPPGLEDALLAGLRRERDQDRAVTTDDDRARRAWDPRNLIIAAVVTLVVLAGTAIGLRVVGGQDGPEAHQVALVGTTLAPDAHAEATIVSKPSGFEITLDIEGLPPAPAGAYYQAWLKSADGDLVTIGTFHAREGGDAIILWSGVDPEGFELLTVTLQKQGGGAESSGQVVLTGTLP